MTSSQDKEESKLRREVQKKSGRPVSQGIWKYLVEERFVSGWFEQEFDTDDLVSHARRLQKVQAEASGSTSPGFLRKQRRTAGVSVRQEALSELLATIASNRADVQVFRGSHLQGKLLQPSDVEQWITETGTRDYKPDGGWYTLDNPAEYLDYFKPSSNQIVSRQIGRRRGVLRKLRELDQALARSSDWLPYQATMFVLTDEIPVVDWLRFNAESRDPYHGLSRIVLKVNPSMTPRELAERYADLRQRVLGKKKLGRISEKHARLAVYAAKIQKSELTPEDMKEWNRQKPQWAYSRFSNFSRDWKKAQHQLLGRYESFPDPRAALFGK